MLLYSLLQIRNPLSCQTQSQVTNAQTFTPRALQERQNTKGSTTSRHDVCFEVHHRHSLFWESPFEITKTRLSRSKCTVFTKQVIFQKLVQRDSIWFWFFNHKSPLKPLSLLLEHWTRLKCWTANAFVMFCQNSDLMNVPARHRCLRYCWVLSHLSTY